MDRISSFNEGQGAVDRRHTLPFWAFDSAARTLIGERQVPHPELMSMALWVESRQCPSASEHVARVCAMARRLALLCGETEAFAQSLFDAAAFHDIGHFWQQAEGVSRWFESDDSVCESMRIHTRMGELFLSNYPGTTMALASAIARAHHECWNGTGYPDGLRGKLIPLGARIVAVVHFFEENTQLDPWGARACHPVDEVFEMISIAAGYYFDPMVARTFCEHAQDFLVLGGGSACAEVVRSEVGCNPVPVPGTQQAKRPAVLTLEKVLELR